MSFIEQIDSIIKWMLANNDSQSIDLLLEKNLELSVLSYYYASIVGDAYKESLMSEAMYKADLSEMEQEKQKSMGVGKAKTTAEVEMKQGKLKWIGWQAEYKKNQLKLSQINTIIDQQRQRISYLKKELEGERKG